MSVSSQCTSMPPGPLRPELYGMHVCATDNLHLLYPSRSNADDDEMGGLRATPREMQMVHALHRRVRVVALPHGVGLEQQAALDRHFLHNAVRASAAR